MIMKQLLGISLALIMLVGSTPFGFSDSLRVQLEQEIETDQLQCENPNHVLVQRTNEKLACVTEKTALKTGWEIIKVNDSISDDAPDVITTEKTKVSDSVSLNGAVTTPLSLDEMRRIATRLEEAIK